MVEILSLTPGQITALYNECTQDPLQLGLLNKTNAQRVVILNTPGTASAPNRVLVVHDQPIMKAGAEFMMLISDIDGLIQRNNLYGAGALEVLKWMDTSNDDQARICRFFCHPAAQCDTTSTEYRGVWDYLAGVEIQIGSPPVTYTMISDAALTALLELGMVLMSRARELIGRSCTEADLVEAGVL